MKVSFFKLLFFLSSAFSSKGQHFASGVGSSLAARGACIPQTVDGSAHPRLQPSFPTVPPPPSPEERLWGQERLRASGPKARRGLALKCCLQPAHPTHVHSDGREDLLFPRAHRSCSLRMGGHLPRLQAAQGCEGGQLAHKGSRGSLETPKRPCTKRSIVSMRGSDTRPRPPGGWWWSQGQPPIYRSEPERQRAHLLLFSP